MYIEYGDENYAQIRLLRTLMKQTIELAVFMQEQGRPEDVKKLKQVNYERWQEIKRIQAERKLNLQQEAASS